MLFRAQMWPQRKRSRSTRRPRLPRYLPSDMIFQILSHLPPKVLVRFMSVCTAWNSTIRSQEFIKARHDRSMKANSPRTILFQRPSKEFSLSVNFDGEGFDNAVPPLRIRQPPQPQASMFGYCNGLVCIKYRNSLSEAQSFLIWNPSIHRFKRIPFTAIELPADTKKWPAWYGFGYDSTNDDYKLVRVIATEKYDEFPAPPVKYEYPKLWTLEVLDGYPCVYPRPHSPAKYIDRSDAWIMKKECGGEGHHLGLGGALFRYDLEKKILEEVDIFGKPSGFSTAISLGNLHLLDGDPVIPS
ncbi:hypothetical protein ACLB2K_010388 [Fragaria x ananassa]